MSLFETYKCACGCTDFYQLEEGDSSLHCENCHHEHRELWDLEISLDGGKTYMSYPEYENLTDEEYDQLCDAHEN